MKNPTTHRNFFLLSTLLALFGFQTVRAETILFEHCTDAGSGKYEINVFQHSQLNPARISYSAEVSKDSVKVGDYAPVYVVNTGLSDNPVQYVSQEPFRLDYYVDPYSGDKRTFKSHFTGNSKVDGSPISEEMHCPPWN